MAESAAGAGEFERFHDLAWRAVQLGPKNDPALMFLLARAQNLSGRPGDARVMLARLAALGAPATLPEGDTHLYGKSLNPQGESGKGAGSPGSGLTQGVTAPPQPPDALQSRPSAATSARGSLAAAAGSAPTPSLSPSERAPGTSPAVNPPALESSSSRGAVASGLPALRFSTARFTAAGLAYDAVSRRFVVGDRHGRKLSVVDEFSRHVANLAGARTSGFGEIAALEIDARRGDLWVVSSEGQTTSLHKLQLISGRLLAAYPIAERLAPVRFADVAVADGGTVLALDTAGHRLFQLQPRATAVEPGLTLPDASPVSIAPAEAGVVYVATADGILRVDLASRAVAEIKTTDGVDVGGLTRIRWHRGVLAGIQTTAPGAYRAVRIALDRTGRRATALAVLDPGVAISSPTAASVIGGVLYYLADDDESGMAVRRVSLQ